MRERKINTTLKYRFLPSGSEIPIEVKTNFLTTDSNGMQISPYSQKLEKTNPKSKLMIFMGGSTTECSTIEQKSRYPRLVSEILTEKYNLGLCAPSMRVSAEQHTRNSIIALYAKVIPLKPNYVVLHHAINDAAFLIANDHYWGQNIGSRSLIRHIKIDKTRATFRELYQVFIRATFPYLHKKINLVTSNLIGGNKPKSPENYGPLLEYDVEMSGLRAFNVSFRTLPAFRNSENKEISDGRPYYVLKDGRKVYHKKLRSGSDWYFTIENGAEVPFFPNEHGFYPNEHGDSLKKAKIIPSNDTQKFVELYRKNVLTFIAIARANETQPIF